MISRREVITVQDNGLTDGQDKEPCKRHEHNMSQQKATHSRVGKVTLRQGTG